MISNLNNLKENFIQAFSSGIKIPLKAPEVVLPPKFQL